MPRLGGLAELADHATSSLAAAQQVGQQLGVQGQQLVVHAQTAFVDGFSQSLLAGPDRGSGRGDIGFPSGSQRPRRKR